ncbi:plasmid partitioning protein RepB C-terminal domain-containing protein [Methylorubrum thiocyanatum]|uniref:ParB family chromosome partitioning protein n=1 Tax=Methylorubrum thiocyanatum TaxID=47958 RepID=A0AA40S521_9HYPH|nr:plasmid partitioning protein RepB C-terminal domain-containing protein [Methylorubrum thiocyanatum]MBA8914708.1 ParB family chromosome partitioning protein [Methylorubrum thiocyanatum]GJE79121.1 Nucleoid occlusion protein [Methylorubrum thiocyanatum]
MTERVSRRIATIPVDRITVLNPRSREKQRFREIVENIGKVGLKRPITVTRIPSTDGQEAYGVVCGEGRLKACIDLGETTVAAIVIEASEQDCLVMSLVENCARRKHRPADLLHDVGALRGRGYTDTQIAAKIGCTPQWVSMVGGLIERGEERLLSAVETGILPVSVAVEIAKADETGVQALLAQAYAEKKLSGGKLIKVRRLLEARRKRGREADANPFGRKETPRRPTSTAALLKVFQQEAGRERVLVKKAELTQSRLMFVVEAMRKLRGDAAFVALLRAERLDAMPADLDDRVSGRAT